VGLPQFQGKGYSKALPASLRRQFEAALADPELLSLHGEAAVLQARLYELARRLDSGESAALWELMRQRHAELAEAIATKDEAKIMPALAAMDDALERGYAVEDAWREWIEAANAKNKIAKGEWTRLRDLRQLITAEQALTVMNSLAQSIKRHVTDPAVLRAIAGEMDQLLEGPRRINKIEAEAGRDASADPHTPDDLGTDPPG
jgi:hypothetical protein